MIADCIREFVGEERCARYDFAIALLACGGAGSLRSSRWGRELTATSMCGTAREPRHVTSTSESHLNHG
jgi:hypothetical protein